MKKKELEQIRLKQIKELKKMINEKQKEINLCFAKIKAGQEKNTKKVKNFRKDLSQILTVLKEKEIVEKGGD